MPKTKLDAAKCLAATCKRGSKKTDYWDTVTTGFLLEVRASGGKTYALRYVDGQKRQRQIKIGGFDDITFAQAQKIAKRLRSEVVLDGNPALRKERTKAIPIYAELARQHIEHARSYQKRPENTETVMNTHLLPRWGTLRLDEITSQAVSKWLAEKRKDLAPATVEKLRMMLGRSFELGRQWNIPGAEINPVRSVPRFRFDNARERYLTTEEAQRLLEACRQSENILLTAIVSLLMLTGARKNELLKAKWAHIDLAQRSWLIPDSKTGKARRVPLSSAAVAVIEDLPRFAGCEWLVPNPRTKRPYTCLKRPWDTAGRRRASLICASMTCGTQRPAS